jgi:hypothetical protein
MATNLAIDDGLLNLALELGGMKTKKDTVNTALQEFIQRNQETADECISRHIDMVIGLQKKAVFQFRKKNC